MTASLSPGFHAVAPGRIAAVVTHLEMREPPAMDGVPPLDGAAIDLVPDPGTTWYRDLFTRVGTLDWLWFSRLRMDDATLAEVIGSPSVEVHALVIGGRAEGLMELDFRADRACELAFLGLTPAAQGKGLGRAMMAVGVERAFARGIDCLHVHTCTFDSPVALPFYIRSGFVPVRREVEVVDDPRLDGTVPPGAAPHVPVIAREV